VRPARDIAQCSDLQAGNLRKNHLALGRQGDAFPAGQAWLPVAGNLE
jgi:hypothetical protein